MKTNDQSNAHHLSAADDEDYVAAKMREGCTPSEHIRSLIPYDEDQEGRLAPAALVRRCGRK